MDLGQEIGYIKRQSFTKAKAVMLACNVFLLTVFLSLLYIQPCTLPFDIKEVVS